MSNWIKKRKGHEVRRDEEWVSPELFSIEEIDESLVIGMTFRFADSKETYQAIYFPEDAEDQPLICFDRVGKWDDHLRLYGCAIPEKKGKVLAEEHYIRVVDFAAMIKRGEVVDCAFCEYWLKERNVWTFAEVD